MTQRHSALLDPQQTALLVVDVQERFQSVMAGFDAMLAGCVRLTRACGLLELPVLVTEQYPRGLGTTVGALREVFGSVVMGEKTRFSALGCREVTESLRSRKIRTVLVCGIEAHVCVQQTVHDLLAEGYGTHVAVDAIASRDPANAERAIARMGQAGAILTTTEMAAFELLVDAKHPHFKEVQSLFK